MEPVPPANDATSKLQLNSTAPLPSVNQQSPNILINPFSGNLNRSQFLLRYLLSIFIFIFLILILTTVSKTSVAVQKSFMVDFLSIFLIIFIYQLSIFVRRLRDAGRSPFWALLALFIYPINFLLFLFLLLIPGKKVELTSETSPKHKKALFFIDILLIILIILGIYLMLFTDKIFNPNPRSSTNTSTEITPSLDTTNWKTYTNAIDQYSIKYPSDLYMNCPIKGDDSLFLFDGKEGVDECYAGEEPTAFYVQVLSKPKDYQKTGYENCYSVNQEKTIIDGIEATKYTNIINNTATAGTPCEFVNGLAKNAVTISLNLDNKYYEIFYDNSNNEALKEKILSTFKFLNSNKH